MFAKFILKKYLLKINVDPSLWEAKPFHLLTCLHSMGDQASCSFIGKSSNASDDIYKRGVTTKSTKKEAILERKCGENFYFFIKKA